MRYGGLQVGAGPFEDSCPITFIRVIADRALKRPEKFWQGINSQHFAGLLDDPASLPENHDCFDTRNVIEEPTAT